MYLEMMRESQLDNGDTIHQYIERIKKICKIDEPYKALSEKEQKLRRSLYGYIQIEQAHPLYSEADLINLLGIELFKIIDKEPELVAKVAAHKIVQRDLELINRFEGELEQNAKS